MGRSQTTWRPDILPGFESAPLGDSTLVRSLANPAPPKSVVLHVHGYNDYFFQSHLGHAIVDAGHAFYAVDLPRAGRSLKRGDIPHFASRIDDHTRPINDAVCAVAALHPGVPIVVHAHSTGGLMACVWAKDRGHPALKGIVLNAPLLGFVGARSHHIFAGLVPLVARIRPECVVAISPSVYAFHQHKDNGGRWEFDTALKRPQGVPIRAGWYAAVRAAQARVAAGLGLETPVLLAHSDSSGPDVADNPLLDSQDTVVEVDAIRALGPGIGPQVTELVVEGAVHDLSLSADAPRGVYLLALTRFIEEVAR